MAKTSSADVIDAWLGAGRAFDAGGVTSFASERGEGEAVLCMHGVPASSFLYRKVLSELADRGLRGVAFDLPGLGLAARPADFDYSWSGLGRWCVAAVEELGLERFHLVVHDVGGPVGFELAAAMPDRVASLLVLDTVVEAHTFSRPWSMEPFARRGLGEAYLKLLSKPAFRLLMRLQGVGDMAQVTSAELGAYVELLKREDGGAAFLKIMRGFERTPEKSELYKSVLASDDYPVDVLWGAGDPALTPGVHGRIAAEAAGLPVLETVPGKHFIQEDQAPAIADRVVRLVARA